MTDAAAAQSALTELLKQQADINAKVEAQRKATREVALATVKEYCTAHKFTATDLKGALTVKRAGAAAKKAPPRKSTRTKK
jgi:hypothetical protein